MTVLTRTKGRTGFARTVVRDATADDSGVGGGASGSASGSGIGGVGDGSGDGVYFRRRGSSTADEPSDAAGKRRGSEDAWRAPDRTAAFPTPTGRIGVMGSGPTSDGSAAGASGRIGGGIGGRGTVVSARDFPTLGAKARESHVPSVAPKEPSLIVKGEIAPGTGWADMMDDDEDEDLFPGASELLGGGDDDSVEFAFASHDPEPSSGGGGGSGESKQQQGETGADAKRKGSSNSNERERPRFPTPPKRKMSEDPNLVKKTFAELERERALGISGGGGGRGNIGGHSGVGGGAGGGVGSSRTDHPRVLLQRGTGGGPVPRSPSSANPSANPSPANLSSNSGGHGIVGRVPAPRGAPSGARSSAEAAARTREFLEKAKADHQRKVEAYIAKEKEKAEAARKAKLEQQQQQGKVYVFF